MGHQASNSDKKLTLKKSSASLFNGLLGQSLPSPPHCFFPHFCNSISYLYHSSYIVHHRLQQHSYLESLRFCKCIFNFVQKCCFCFKGNCAQARFLAASVT